MPSPSGADPSTQRLDVLVFPGPLSLVQAEVARVAVGTPDGAYGFALSSAAARLAGATGVEADANALRRLQIVSWQRVVRQLRSPDPVVAATLLSGLADVDGHLLAAEAKPRLVQVVQDHQRADGSWLIGDSGSLQRMLVQTAYVARALPADAKAPRARARGVVERHAKEIEDPYTAAVVLASGLADGATATALAKVVEKGLTTASDGARTVNTPSGVQNPWGARPSRAELLAWTILASPEASWRGDLVSELISGWDARWGFGAGSADVIALQAALAGLPPLGQEVEVVLSLDGVDVARARLDPKQPKVPALLEAAPSAKDPKIALRAEPPIPGLAWVATQRSWSAWRGDEGIPGVEVEARASRLVVGQDGAVILTVAAPTGASVRVVQGLPAGVSVDAARLSGQDGVVDAQARTDSVALRTRPFGAGEVMELRIPVRPSFAGRFATAPLEIEVEGRSVTVAPMIWEVSGG
jgi:hypothetical protein